LQIAFQKIKLNTNNYSTKCSQHKQFGTTLKETLEQLCSTEYQTQESVKAPFKALISIKNKKNSEREHMV